MNRAPLRFLITVLVLWAGVRAAILLPGDAIAPVPVASAAPQLVTASTAFTPQAIGEAARPATASRKMPPEIRRQAERARLMLLAAKPSTPLRTMQMAPAIPGRAASSPRLTPMAGAPTLPSRPTASRWSVSAWLLIRDDGGLSLAPGGTLGGSQVGARLSYRLGRGLSLSARAYLPVRHRAGAEFAAGIDWRPSPSVPLNFLAERRQRLGRDGRNAFALTLYGGASPRLTDHLRLDLYGQAGAVGLRSRDLFVDGSARLSRRIGPVELGAGAWGAAQPGAARLDAGPSLSWRLPVPRANLRLQADWRFRVAGTAAPGSGPALTLAADF